MGNFLSYLHAAKTNQFQVNYPYYGLFGTANVTLVNSEEEPLYECKLMNGAVLLLKKITNSKRWIDAGLNSGTPLAQVIGTYIDDYMMEQK